jgi:hypothetical protein
MPLTKAPTSSYGGIGPGSTNGLEGLHVNILLEDLTRRQKWGLYLDTNTLWSGWQQPLDFYAQVRERLTTLAQYIWQPTDNNPVFSRGANDAATTIAKYRDWLYNGHGNIGEL